MQIHEPHSGRDTFLPHEPKGVLSRCHGARASVYLTKPFAPLSASPPTGLSRSSPSAQGNFNYRPHFFQPTPGLLWSNEALWPARNSISSPVNLRALSHARGAVTGQGRGVAPPGDVFPYGCGEAMHIYGVVFIYCQLFYWMSAGSLPSVSSGARGGGFATRQQNQHIM